MITRRRRWLLGLASTAAVLAAMAVFGPYEPVDTDIAFDPATLPGDLDAYLAATEGAVAGITPGVEKRIIWAGQAGAQTDLAVIYLHGFSGTSQEIRPVPDLVAKALDANLFYTRLTGHGQDGAAMAQATAGDWLEDVAQAYAIGRRIGREVIVISTSTGGTLATAAAIDPRIAGAVAGQVMISPNFGLANPAGALLAFPAARIWVPLVAGRTFSLPPVSPAHARYWTLRYPTVATLAMAALVKHVGGLDLSAATMPALFITADADAVVSASATRAVAEQWGGPVTLHPVTVGPDDDPYSHVIAGDILSPSMTGPVTDIIVAWVNSLPR